MCELTHMTKASEGQLIGSQDFLTEGLAREAKTLNCCCYIKTNETQTHVLEALKGILSSCT